MAASKKTKRDESEPLQLKHCDVGDLVELKTGETGIRGAYVSYDEYCWFDPRDRQGNRIPGVKRSTLMRPDTGVEKILMKAAARYSEMRPGFDSSVGEVDPVSGT